jgi:hypothetical protein
MSYESCLEAAGATVHDFISIGDYTGTWYALVSYGDVTGIVSGSYGSCSGCDSYCAASEEAWSREERGNGGEDWRAEFGRGYLTDIQSPKDFVAYHQDSLDSGRSWEESETKEILEWIARALDEIGVVVPTAMAPFRATFQYDFGVKFNPEVGIPTEPGRQYVFDKIRAEIENVGLDQWLDSNLFGIRPNG